MVGLTLHDTDASTDRNISVVQNWNLFGYSSVTPINVSNIIFANLTNSTINWSTAVSQGKVLAYFMYRDNNVYRYAATPDFGMQDYALRQNRSYWIKVNEVCNSSQPCNLSMPGVGGSLAGRTYKWRDLRFTNGTLDLNITKADDATNGWIEQYVWYWDTTDGVFYAAPTDTTTLYIWNRGYFIWVKQSNVQLIRRN